MKKLLSKFGPFLGLLLVIGLFSLSGEIRDYFLSYANFKIILTQTVIVAIGALGMTLIIISGGIDLSVGSVIALCSVVGALLIQQAWPLVAVVLMVIAAGGLVGLLNGAAIAAEFVSSSVIWPSRLRSRRSNRRALESSS